jgi:NAD(P)-dependent dehydrogenase (short-subunit alcohol dehydrogenase family)
MKGAVTGVFSYSGRFIAEALLARGWEVVALGRRRPAPAESLVACCGYTSSRARRQ